MEVLVPTCSNGGCFPELWIHLILAGLSFALFLQSVDCAADAQRNQQPCQRATGHFVEK